MPNAHVSPQRASAHQRAWPKGTRGRDAITDTRPAPTQGPPPGHRLRWCGGKGARQGAMMNPSPPGRRLTWARTQRHHHRQTAEILSLLSKPKCGARSPWAQARKEEKGVRVAAAVAAAITVPPAHTCAVRTSTHEEKTSSVIRRRRRRTGRSGHLSERSFFSPGEARATPCAAALHGRRGAAHAANRPTSSCHRAVCTRPQGRAPRRARPPAEHSHLPCRATPRSVSGHTAMPDGRVLSSIHADWGKCSARLHQARATPHARSALPPPSPPPPTLVPPRW